MDEAPSTPTFRIERLAFDAGEIGRAQAQDPKFKNWPVVYAINDDKHMYVGETVNAAARMRQHLENPEKQGLQALRVVLDEQFNKSVCLDLESYLIRLFAGDGRYTVLNRNDGVTNADYYDRDRYRRTFRKIFDQLRSDELFTKSIDAIENSDLFKLSPFKALNQDQEIAIVDILEGLFDDLESGASSTAVIQGGPGTGKTIVAIYMMKLLSDIAAGAAGDETDSDSVFADFFSLGHRELLGDLKMGLVVPQQALRKSIKQVFAKTPGLEKSMVLTPYEVAKSPHDYDVLIVDETHRLTQYGAQAMGTLTKDFREISQRVANDGEDWQQLTQIDWIVRKSSHQVFMLDQEQSVRPIDVPARALERVRSRARESRRSYPLTSQMRVKAGSEYLDFVRELLSDEPPSAPRDFGAYDLRFFDRFEPMVNLIRQREREVGLSRLVAGYGWEWRSKSDPSAPDIVIENLQLQWNRTQVDWINSPGSIDEVGSIHTVQGYDLNYAAVIIGNELRADRNTGQVGFSRDNYFDRKGKANNNLIGVEYSDQELLGMVRNIYRVLMTRGMLGTYVYVCDPALRERFRTLLPNSL